MLNQVALGRRSISINCNPIKIMLVVVCPKVSFSLSLRKLT